MSATRNYENIELVEHQKDFTVQPDADHQHAEAVWVKENLSRRKWWQLALLIQTGFGVNFAYDALGAIAPVLKRELNISDAHIGSFYSCYSIASVICSLPCGILLDRFGPGKLIVATAIILCIGTAIVALATNFGVMFFGQLLYGIGSAPLYMILISTIETWFRGDKNQRLKTSVTLCLSVFWMRTASFFSFNVLPMLAKHFDFRIVLGVSWGSCVLSLISGVLFYLTYQNDTPKPLKKSESTNNKSGRFRNFSDAVKAELKELWDVGKRISGSYYLITLIYTLLLPSMHSFTAFGTVLLVDNRGYSVDTAARITSLDPIANALSSPIMGYIVGSVGKRTYFLLFANLWILVAYSLFTFSTIHPAFLFVAVGLAQSVLDATIFPSVSIIVDHTIAGRATSIMMLINDLSSIFLPIIIGALKDSAGYIGAVSVLIVLTAFSFIGSTTLKVVDIRNNNALDKVEGAEDELEYHEISREDSKSSLMEGEDSTHSGTKLNYEVL